MTNMMIGVEDIGLVNCAGCWRELLGERTAARLESGCETRAELPPPVGGRLHQRPYCLDCYRGKGGATAGRRLTRAK